MQIDSNLSGYQYPTRSYVTERVSEEPGAREVEQARASGSGLTGSSTFLSSSLAEALLDIGDGFEQSASPAIATETGMGGVSADWVEGLYREFADN